MSLWRWWLLQRCQFLLISQQKRFAQRPFAPLDLTHRSDLHLLALRHLQCRLSQKRKATRFQLISFDHVSVSQNWVPQIISFPWLSKNNGLQEISLFCETPLEMRHLRLNSEPSAKILAHPLLSLHISSCHIWKCGYPLAWRLWKQRHGHSAHTHKTPSAMHESKWAGKQCLVC